MSRSESRSRSRSRTRPASARRTVWSGNGRGAEPGRASLPISAMRAPTSSGRSARPVASGQHSPCTLISTRSLQPSPKARMPCSCSTAKWHTTDKLIVPKNVSLVFLPSRFAELNPVENIWQYPTRELALEPRLRHLCRYPRCRLRNLEQAHRSALRHRLYRYPEMSPYQSCMRTVGIRETYARIRVDGVDLGCFRPTRC